MKVIIMRGIPGSGKSTLINKMMDTPPSQMSDTGIVEIVSADHYFHQDGSYKFDPTKLPQAHDDCLFRFTSALMYRTCHTMFVDNTNVRLFEIAPYYRLAEAFDCEVKIMWIHCDPKAAAEKCKHGVPAWKIEEMAKSFEPLPAWWNVQHYFQKFI